LEKAIEFKSLIAKKNTFFLFKYYGLNETGNEIRFTISQ